MTFKRFFVGVLITVLLFLQLADDIFASSVGLMQSNDQYVTAAENHLVQLSENSVSGGSQNALFSDLKTVLEYAMYFDFLQENSSLSELDISDDELRVYAKQLNTIYKSFNAAYAVQSESFSYLQLNAGRKKFNYAKIVKYTRDTLANDVSSYLDNYLSSFSGYSEEELKTTYALSLNSLYLFLTSISDSAEVITNWKANGNFKITVAETLVSILNNIYSSYDVLLGVGAAVESQKSDEEITVDTSKAFIENMSDVSVDDKGNIQISATPKLSLAYLAIVSASAVYTPFVSHTGCAEFMSALKDLPKTEDSADVALLYNSTKSYKKPLYKRDLDKVGDPTGSAEMITLQEFISDIESGNTGALCTILGNLGNNGSDWVYSQDDITTNQSAPIVNFNGETQAMSLDDYQGAINININVNADSNGSGDINGTGVNSYSTSPLTDQLDEGASSTESTENTENTEASVGSKLSEMFKVSAALSDGFTESSSVGDSSGHDVYAHKSVTDESAMSAPVVFYGTKYARAVDNLTTALMSNILKTEGWAANVDDSSYLYVNVYGDVVLDDDTVVLPAAANPLMYRGKYYNPFTVAFMNSYPSVLKNTGKFKLAGKSDVGKYLCFGVIDSTGIYTSFVATKSTSVSTVETQGPLTYPLMITDFTSNYGVDKVAVFKTRKLLFGEDDSAWEDTSKYNSYCPFVINTVLTVNGESVFPYDQTTDTTRLIAKAIANNMFAYYGVNDTTFAKSNQKKLNDAYILDALIINVLGGTDNASGYQDDLLLKYDNYVDNSAERKYKSLLNLSNNILDKVDSVSGIVGIKSVYDNQIAGKVLSVLSDNLVLFFFVLLLVLLFFFSKARLDLLQCTVFALAFFGCSYLYVNVLPSIMPAAFNLFTNNAVQNLSYEILGMEAEQYSLDKATFANIDSKGNIDMSSTSITLYKTEGHDRTGLATSAGFEVDDVIGGNVGVINEQGGVYIKNDEICVNTNILFDTLVIDGKFGSDYSYVLSSKKSVSNNVDYYVPYYEIVDSLIGKINDISQIYSIPRKTTTYANGVVKDNYLLYSYVNSKPFITPGQYGFILPVSGADWTEEEISAYAAEATTIEKKLTDSYGKNVDWLGIAGWIYNLSDAERKTLWAQTLQNLGYYDQYWNPDREKMDDLVSYVNYQTKKFVYDVSEQIGTLSDDVMIKVVSLRALIALTQRASDFGHWMYPFTINYEDMRMDNILSSIFISDYSRYVEMNMNTTTYILNEHGWFSLIVFDTDVILLFVLASLLNFVVPLFYLLVGILILFRLLIGQDFKLTIKGYLKASLITILCSTALALSVLAIKAMNGAAIGIYALLIAVLFILYVLLTMILSVVRNFSEFGNTSLSVKFSDITDGIKKQYNQSIHKNTSYTQNLIYNKQKKYDGGSTRRGRYHLDNGVNDFYDYTPYFSVQTQDEHPETYEDLSQLADDEIVLQSDEEFTDDLR